MNLPDLIHPLNDWAYACSCGPERTSTVYAYNARNYDRRVLICKLGLHEARDMERAMNSLRMKMIADDRPDAEAGVVMPQLPDLLEPLSGWFYVFESYHGGWWCVKAVPGNPASTFWSRENTRTMAQGLTHDEAMDMADRLNNQKRAAIALTSRLAL
jgi:hypothetical protein